MSDLLFPDPSEHDEPTSARADYRAVRDQLRRSVIGHDYAVDRLALAGVQHMRGGVRPRFVLVGPSGCGKSTLARALARAIELPYAIIDVTELAETNWSGLQLADVLTQLYHDASEDMTLMRKAIIVLDELDKIAVAATDGSTRNYRLGKQQSLLGLLGGGVPLRFGSGAVAADRSLTWSADHAMVIGAGVFSGLRPDVEMTPADLIALGLMPELVERFGEVIRLRALSGAELEAVLAAALEPLYRQYRAFGYELQVAPAAVRYAAAAVTAGVGEAGPRSGAAWLTRAANQALLTLLNGDAAAGTVYVLRPDDVNLPSHRGERGGRH